MDAPAVKASALVGARDMARLAVTLCDDLLAEKPQQVALAEIQARVRQLAADQGHSVPDFVINNLIPSMEMLVRGLGKPQTPGAS